MLENVHQTRSVYQLNQNMRFDLFQSDIFQRHPPTNNLKQPDWKSWYL